MPDIMDSVFHHCESGQTDAEGESAVFMGIDSAVPQDFRMNQAAGDQFDPAISAGGASFSSAEQALQIQFKSRFNEGEKAGPKTDLHLFSKNFTENGLHYSDQVGNGNILIDHESFTLIKSILMAGIDGFISKTPAGKNRANRSAKPF